MVTIRASALGPFEPLPLATRLAVALGSAESVGPGPTSGWYWAGGSLVLDAHGESGEISVPVHIRVPQSWFETPPIVTAFARFLRQESDWHTAKSSFPLPWATDLCYVLDEEWQKFFAELIACTADAAISVELGVMWIIENVNSLLSRHLIGSRYSLRTWPEEWKAWKHRQAGRHQFRSEYPSANWRRQFIKLHGTQNRVASRHSTSLSNASSI